MFGSELPSWKQILTNKYNKKGFEHSFWNENNLIWTSQSAISIRLIIENFGLVEKKERIKVWIPDFFCAETEQLFRTEKVQINYYPIKKTFEPDWNVLKEMIIKDIPDIFVFVHYFGIYLDINRAKEFCKKYNILLIEDCAHVLYNLGKFGSKGDFTVYSPHKILPVCDGGIISYNEKDERVQVIVKGIKKQLEEKQQIGNCAIWRVKKALQKIIKKRRSTTFKVKAHFDNEEPVSSNKVRLQISEWSYNKIIEYNVEDIKKIAYVRCRNLGVMNYIVNKIIPEAIPVMNKDVKCPYVAIYSVENIEDKQAALEKLERAGILVTFWPTLSNNIKNMPYRSIAPDISKNLLVVPIHQGMTPQYLINRCLSKIERKNIEYRFEKITNIKDCNEMFDVELNNIPQDLVYGTTKSKIEGDCLSRYKIFDLDGKHIGFLQSLVKRKFGVKYAVRVNRGPIMVRGYNNPETIFQVMDQFRKMMRPLPIFYAPNIEYSPYNLHLVCSYNWTCWNMFGYSSGVINLEETEEVFRKKLDSKWRNQLVAAEKKGLFIRNNNSIYKDALEIYLKDQKDKNYIGISNNILVYLFEMKDSPLDTYYVLDKENNLIAFDIIYRQQTEAHYLVGWNSDKGRKLYLNNFLLYYVSISLKEKGVKQFDLGGIDYINTEDIARFKDGMRPEKYCLMGEFVK